MIKIQINTGPNNGWANVYSDQDRNLPHGPPQLGARSPIQKTNEIKRK